MIRNILSRIKKVVLGITLEETASQTANNDLLMWSGKYSDWEAAKNNTTGYDADNILKICRDSLLKVKNGEAVYERDGFLFSKKQYSWPVLAALLKVAGENENQLHVIDFGGSLGSSYYQNRAFMSHLSAVRWGVVEQEHFVLEGKKYFEGKELHFYETVAEAKGELKKPILFLSSVLQYLENPRKMLDEFLQEGFEYIIIDRTSFIEDLTRLTVQNVPEYIYKASYPMWFFNEIEFVRWFEPKYDLIADFSSYCDGDFQLEDGKRAYWKGWVFKRKIS